MLEDYLTVTLPLSRSSNFDKVSKRNIKTRSYCNRRWNANFQMTVGLTISGLLIYTVFYILKTELLSKNLLSEAPQSLQYLPLREFLPLFVFIVVLSCIISSIQYEVCTFILKEQLLGKLPLKCCHQFLVTRNMQCSVLCSAC